MRPGILFNYMGDPLDWHELRDGIRITSRIMRQPERFVAPD